MKRTISLLAAVIIYAACRLLINQQELLFAAQELLVWRDDWAFTADLLHRPYGLFDIASRMLTQEFFHPWVGILCLLGIWTASAALTQYALRLSKATNWLCVLPIFCLLASITQMGYWIYFLKLSGYWFFFSLLWLWWSLGLVFAFRVKNLYLRIVGIVLMLALLTPWNGWQLQVFFSTENDFVLRPLNLLLVILTIQLIVKGIETWMQTNIMIHETKAWHRYLLLTLCLTALGGGVIWTSMLDYTNERFTTELKAHRLAEEGDWHGIIKLGDQLKREPTRQFVLLRDAALLHTGQLMHDTLSEANTDLQHEYELTKPCNGAIPVMRDAPKILMALDDAPLLYLCYGYVNDAYRWAFEYGVEIGLTQRRIKILLNCALLNQEWDLCRRYIRMLRHTRYHGEYADAAERLIGHPELIAQHPLLSSVAKIRQTNNHLRFENTYIESIILSDPESPIINHKPWHLMGQKKVTTY